MPGYLNDETGKSIITYLLGDLCSVSATHGFQRELRLLVRKIGEKKMEESMIFYYFLLGDRPSK